MIARLHQKYNLGQRKCDTVSFVVLYSDCIIQNNITPCIKNINPHANIHQKPPSSLIPRFSCLARLCSRREIRVTRRNGWSSDDWTARRWTWVRWTGVGPSCGCIVHGYIAVFLLVPCYRPVETSQSLLWAKQVHNNGYLYTSLRVSLILEILAMYKGIILMA